MLAISRVIGETAPLLVVAGATDGINTQPVRRPDDHPARLHLLAVLHARPPVGYERAWGGALVLIVLVMVLNLIARIIGRIFAPAKGH